MRDGVSRNSHHPHHGCVRVCAAAKPRFFTTSPLPRPLIGLPPETPPGPQPVAGTCTRNRCCCCSGPPFCFFALTHSSTAGSFLPFSDDDDDDEETQKCNASVPKCPLPGATPPEPRALRQPSARTRRHHRFCRLKLHQYTRKHIGAAHNAIASMLVLHTMATGDRGGGPNVRCTLVLVPAMASGARVACRKHVFSCGESDLSREGTRKNTLTPRAKL